MIARTSIRFAGALVFATTLAACTNVDVPTSPSTAAVTDTFASQLMPRGIASRTFSVRDTGTVNVTLTSVSPAAQVGLGVGIPMADGTYCNLSRSVEADAGAAPQITTTADGGSYCVKIYDLGTLTTPVSFSITIEHP